MSHFDRAPQGSAGVKRGVDTQRVLSGKRRGCWLEARGKLFTNYAGPVSRDRVLCKRSALQRDQLLFNLLIQISVTTFPMWPQHEV